MYKLTISATDYAVTDISIKKQLKDLNVATGTMVVLGALPSADADVTITYLPTSTVVMVGILKSLKETQKNQYRFEVIERAYQLYDSYVKSGSSYVVNVPVGTTVTSIVDNYILAGDPNGWTRGTTSDGTTMPALQFNYSSRLAALNAILKERRGHMIWFDSVAKKVYFGPYRPGSAYTITTYMELKTEMDSLKRKVTKIIVLGRTDSIQATAGSGEKMLVYRYTDATTVADAQLVADTLLAQSGITRQRVTLDIIPTVTYQEGDRVTVGGTTYLVTDVELRLDKTVLGLISGELTLIDLLGGRLQLVQGGTFTGAQVNWEGGAQNIGASAPGKYVVYIRDKTQVADYYINVKLNKYVKPATTLSKTSGDTANRAITGATAALHTTGLDALNMSTGAYNLTNTATVSNNSIGDFWIDTHNDGFRPGGGMPLYIPSGSEDHVTKDPNSGRTYAYLQAFTLPTCDYQLLLLSFNAVSFSDETYNLFWQVRELYLGTWFAVTSWQRGYLVRSDLTTPVSGTVMFPGIQANKTQTKRYFRVYYTGDGGGVWCDRSWVHITGITTHSHSITQTAHPHTLSDPTHDTTLIDPSHIHSLNEGAGHGTTLNTPLQTHEGSGVDNPSLVNSYPTSVTVTVKNSLYPTGITVLTNPGGSELSFGGDITGYLVTGSNEIIIGSSSAGNVYLSGNYLSYG